MSCDYGHSCLHNSFLLNNIDDNIHGTQSTLGDPRRIVRIYVRVSLGAIGTLLTYKYLPLFYWRLL